MIVTINLGYERKEMSNKQIKIINNEPWDIRDISWSQIAGSVASDTVYFDKIWEIISRRWENVKEFRVT